MPPPSWTNMQWRRQKIFMTRGFIQCHTVVICIWCALFVTSQFDVIFLFPNQRFGEVSRRNMPVVLNRGYTYPLGVRSTETRGTNHQIFSRIHALKFKPRHARPENKKNVFSIVVSAASFRGHALNHRVFKVFCNEVVDQHSVLFHTEVRWLSRVRVLTRV